MMFLCKFIGFLHITVHLIKPLLSLVLHIIILVNDYCINYCGYHSHKKISMLNSFFI